MSEPKSIKKHIMTVDVSQIINDHEMVYYVEIKGKNGTSNMTTDDPDDIPDKIMKNFYYFKSKSKNSPNPYIVNVVNRDNNPTISNNGCYDK